MAARGQRLSRHLLSRTSGYIIYLSRIVLALRKGEDVNIKGNAAKGLEQSRSGSKILWGTGKSIHAGSIIVDGDVDTRMGISMVRGAIYVKGNVKQPLGNVVKLYLISRVSKFISIQIC